MATVIAIYKMNPWGHKIIVLENLKMNSLCVKEIKQEMDNLRHEYYDSSQHYSIFYAFATVILKPAFQSTSQLIVIISSGSSFSWWFYVYFNNYCI